MSEGYTAALFACIIAFAIASVGVFIQSSLRSRNDLKIPRVGLEPGLFGNTSKGHFHRNALQLVQEGYSRVC